MDKADIPYLSTAQLSRLLKSRGVSPVEATESYLERIDQVDGKLNSYITVCTDEALQAAREAEGAIARGDWLGPMHGIPVAVKDQFYTKGIRTTGGSKIFAELVPDEDATVMANLKAAGAVLLGKLNMSEFAMAEIFDHPYGTPRNPWDLGRNPGMSSSGSGAATAAFLCSTSLGEDTGGSIRSPANWCGLVGAPHLGPREPLRRNGGFLVHGHGRAHLPDGRGLRHTFPGHRRIRLQGTIYLECARTRLQPRPRWEHKRHQDRS